MSQHKRTKRGIATKNGNDVSVALEEAESYSPYPPPELVKAFEEIQPGLASRLMQIVEKEQTMSHQVVQHQMTENTKINNANIVNQKHNSLLFLLGLIFAVVLAICILGIVVYAIYKGSTAIGIAGFSALSIVLIILVLRKVPSSSEKPDARK